MDQLQPAPGDRRNVHTWPMLCHLSALAGFVIPAAGHIAGPLLVWLLKRDGSKEVDEHGKESVNFQISILIYSAALGIVCFVLMFVVIGFLLIPLFAVLYLLDVVLVIVASVKANNGELYRYPLTIRLIK